MNALRLHALNLALLALFTLSVQTPAQESRSHSTMVAQSMRSAAAPQIFKIDPPNWWAQMPKPMLLIRGENLRAARFLLSDHSLQIDSTRISENGHWAELWLHASPRTPETIVITVKTLLGSSSASYEFSRRRAEEDGFAGFSSADVMYLIMIDRFADGDLTNDGTPAQHAAELARPRGWHGGDLRGIEQHIDYLQELGVDTIWITPVYQNHGSESYHGYGATDMYSVDEHYGSLKDLRALARSLHEHHMKLVLDTVPNHVGATHDWVNDSPEPDWFHGTAARHTVAQGDFRPLTDLHAPWRDRRNVTEGWFANILPDLNQENPTVARYLIQNAIWWTEEAGLDGLRLDTFPYIARSFWHDFHADLHTLYPRLTTVGEVFDSDAVVTSFFAGGAMRNGSEGSVDTGLDTPFDFPAYFAIRDTLLRDAPMTKLAKVLELDALYPHSERLVTFLGNHDTTRFLNEPGANLQKLELAFTLLTTMRGMPQFHSGDEIAMRGGEDPDNRRDFPGGFTAQTSPNAFVSQNRTSSQRQTFDKLKTLLALRHAHPALESGDQQILAANTNTIIYVRSIQIQRGLPQRILVAINKGTQSQESRIDLPGTVLEGARIAHVLLGRAEDLDLAPGKISLHLSGGSSIIAKIE